MAVADKIKTNTAGQIKVTGDVNLQNLARYYGVTVEALIAANPQWAANNRLSATQGGAQVVLTGATVRLPEGATVPTGDGTDTATDPTSTVPTLGDLNDDSPKMAFDIFAAYAQLAGIDNLSMLQDVYNAAGNYFAEGIAPGDILDLMAVSGTAPESYKSYIAAYNDIRNLNVGVTTIAEWNAAKSQYKSLLSYYGLDDIATDASANEFLKNSVSVQEAADRMQVAYNAVLNADEALRTQLKTYYPSLADKDIVKTILGVGKTVDQLQREIGTAEIKAEAATAGINARLDATELQRQGVTRAQAREGYQTVKAATPGYEAAAARASQSPADIQTELEKENLLGLRSKRRAQLAVREQGLIAGQSGTGAGSLGRNAAGTF